MERTPWYGELFLWLCYHLYHVESAPYLIEENVAQRELVFLKVPLTKIQTKNNHWSSKSTKKSLLTHYKCEHSSYSHSIGNTFLFMFFFRSQCSNTNNAQSAIRKHRTEEKKLKISTSQKEKVAIITNHRLKCSIWPKLPLSPHTVPDILLICFGGCWKQFQISRIYSEIKHTFKQQSLFYPVDHTSIQPSVSEDMLSYVLLDDKNSYLQIPIGWQKLAATLPTYIHR